MKNILEIIFFSLFLLVSCDSGGVPVKKSKTNICHKKGSKYYGVPEAPATPCVNWISQWNHLMAEFPKVKFIKVNPKGIKGHGDDQVNNEIHEWSKNKNISYMSFRELNVRFKLGLTNID